MTLFLNTQDQKTSEKQGKPVSIHHMSRCKVDVEGGGGEGQCSSMYMYMLNLKASSFDHANVWSPKWMIQCDVFAVGPLPPISTSRPPDVIYVMKAPRPSPFFTSCVLL